MLQMMRSGAQSLVIKIVLFGMLTFALLGLAVMDVGGVFRDGVKSNVIAEVGNMSISAPAFDQAVQNNMRQFGQNQNIPKELIVQQTLKNEIETLLYRQASSDMGLVISDKIAAKKLREYLKPLIKQGLNEKEALERALYYQGVSEQAFVYSLKSQIANSQLINAIVIGNHIPQQLVYDAYRYRNEERRAEFFKISYDSAKNTAKPTDEELEKYYSKIARRYALPEYRAFSIIQLSEKNISDAVNISEGEILEAYEDRIDDFTMGQNREIAQAIFPDQETAIQVKEKTQDGAKLAQNITDLKRDDVVFLSAETYDKSGLPKEIAPIAFDAAVGSISGPIKTSFGWHLIYVAKTNDKRTLPLDEVKDELKKDLLRDKSADQLFELANQIEDSLAGGGSFQDAAEEANATTKQFGPITMQFETEAGASIDFDYPEQAKIIDAVFKTAEGEASAMIETQDGQYIIVYVDQVISTRNKPFTQVKADVLKSWTQKEQSTQIRNRSLKLIESIKAGKKIEDVANTVNASFVKTSFLKRADKAEEKSLDDGFVRAMFSMTQENEAMRLPVADGEIIMVLKNIRINEPNKDDQKDDLSSIKTFLLQAAQNDLVQQYKQALTQEFGVNVNEYTVQNLYKNRSDDE